MLDQHLCSWTGDSLRNNPLYVYESFANSMFDICSAGHIGRSILGLVRPSYRPAKSHLSLSMQKHALLCPPKNVFHQWRPAQTRRSAQNKRNGRPKTNDPSMDLSHVTSIDLACSLVPQRRFDKSGDTWEHDRLSTNDACDWCKPKRGSHN